jgi:hypothetical protein
MKEYKVDAEEFITEVVKHLRKGETDGLSAIIKAESREEAVRIVTKKMILCIETCLKGEI